jgi:hypothetical protein
VALERGAALFREEEDTIRRRRRRRGTGVSDEFRPGGLDCRLDLGANGDTSRRIVVAMVMMVHHHHHVIVVFGVEIEAQHRRWLCAVLLPLVFLIQAVGLLLLRVIVITISFRFLWWFLILDE